MQVLDGGPNRNTISCSLIQRAAQKDMAAKETVIIVHGTFAAPLDGKTQWYQRSGGEDGSRNFTTSLDEALEQRGSPARCWAHCAEGGKIFHWSGDNSWIERTSAAANLGNYVARLHNDGWRCHIVAHSHGGNILVEALSEIETAGTLGKIVTLGTPFMNAVGPIMLEARAFRALLDLASWIVFVLAMTITLVFALAVASEQGLGMFIGRWYADVLVAVWLLLFATVLYGHGARTFGGLLYALLWTIPAMGLCFWGFAIVGSWSELGSDVYFSSWLHIVTVFVFVVLSCSALSVLAAQVNLLAGLGVSKGSESPWQVLALGSAVDEAWQVLHHIGNIGNPLAVASGLFAYLGRSAWNYISYTARIARIRGAKTYRDIRIVPRFFLIVLQLSLFGAIGVLFLPSSDRDWVAATFGSLERGFLVIVMIILAVVLLFSRVLGPDFYSAFWLPARWCARLFGAIIGVVNDSVTYLVRSRGWGVLVRLVMGLEGYRLPLPRIEQYPAWLPKSSVKFENMPAGAEQRALVGRQAWINIHFGNVTELFSKMVVTPPEMGKLLRDIEANPTLVHAAYYTDDECIGRIADWIAGKG